MIKIIYKPLNLLKMMKKILVALCIGTICACSSAGSFIGTGMSVDFAKPSPWGDKIIDGSQICSIDGGVGATPPLVIRNVPKGTNAFIVEFNDADDLSLSYGGGLGTIAYKHDGSDTAWLLPVKGETPKMPEFAFIYNPHRFNNVNGSGYMPPCSGAKKHHYFAIVKAVDLSITPASKNAVVLDTKEIDLGVY